MEQGIHVVAKPVGPICNIDCEYCFYLEKRALFRADERYRMSDDVLDAFVRGYIRSQPTPLVEFVWQGGEPTLLGLDYFDQAPFAFNGAIEQVHVKYLTPPRAQAK